MAKGKELEALISIAGKVDPSLQKSLKEAQKEANGFTKGLKVAGAVAATATAAAVTGAVAAGKALFDLGSQFKDAENTIRVGTGATGEDLQDLYQSMEEVYKSVPTTLGDASSVIADYNTRLGLTGDNLEGLSTQALQVSKILGEDVSAVVEESSQAFQQWNIDSDDMGDAMDYIFKVSQSTGMGFNDLMGDLQSYGAQLQELGFDFETSAALMGNVEKSGYNVSTVLGGMKKAVKNLADEGIDASDGLQQYYDQILNAKDATEAITIATDIFGGAAGSTMASAIRDGTLSVDDLVASLKESNETIATAAEDTYTLQERWEMLKQKGQVALEPMAKGLMGIAEDVMPLVTEAFDELLPVLTDLSATVLPILQDAGQDLLPVIGDALKEVVGIIKDLAPFLGEVLGMVMGMLSSLMPILVKIVQAVLPIAEQIIRAVLSIMEQLFPIMTSIIESVLPVVEQLLNAIAPVITMILNVLSPIISLIGQLISALLPPIVSIIETLMPILNTVISIISTGLTVALQVLTPIIEGIISLVGTIADVFGSAFEAAVGVIKGPINTIIGMVNGIISSINGIGFTIPDWVPVIGGKGFTIDIPQIPMLATGGFTDGISIAGEAGTEAVISFDAAYRNQNLSYWAKAGEMLGVDSDGIDDLVTGNTTNNSSTTEYNLGGVTFAPNVTVDGNSDKQGVIEGIREAEKEFFDMLDEWWHGREDDDYDPVYG